MPESAYWNRFWRRRISRRALLGAGAVTAVGAASAAIVGCGGGSSGSSDGGNGGNTITAGRSVEVLGIDPHIDLTGLEFDLLLYSYLYSWNRFTEEAVLNNLAEEFEFPDPLHINFKLRQGVKCSPVGPAAGEEITSNDVLQSFIRRGTALTAPDKRFAERFLPDRGGGSLEAPDDYTFNIVLDRPFVPAIREMANPTWAIVPAKVIDAYPNLGQIAFGSGPFMLEEFRGSERVVLKKNPNFWMEGRPHLDGYRTIIIQENSSLLAAFRNGQHDINGSILDRPTADDLDDDGRYLIDIAPTLFYPVVHMKVIRPPWDNDRVREAFDLAINRDEIIDVIWDSEGNYNGPIQWPQFKWTLPQDELRNHNRYDPDRARQILEEEGVPQVNAVMKAPELTGPTIFADIAQLVQNQVRQVGFNIEIDFVELGTFIANVILPGNFDLAFFPNLPYDEPDRPLSFYHSRGVTGAGNWTNYTNPELDELIDAQSQEFDEDKRIEIVMDAQRMILPEHGPQITLPSGNQYFARWNYVELGPAGSGIIAPESNEFGPPGTDLRIVER